MKPARSLADGWRLEIGDAPQAVDAESVTPGATKSIDEPLEHAVHVLTVEQSAWGFVAVWTIAIHFMALARLPLNRSGAGAALYAYDLAYRTNEATLAGFHGNSANWIQLVQAAIFAMAGAGDVTARIVQILAGCLMLVAVFVLRPYLGRAAGLATGAILALSPTLTYLSRGGWAGIVAGGASLIAIVLFARLTSRPTRGRAAALGIAIGLMLSSGLVGTLVGFSLAATFGFLGIVEAVAGRHGYLSVRVWLIRYGGLLLTTFTAALFVCILVQVAVGGPFGAIADELALLPRPSVHEVRKSLAAMVLPLGFYEYLTCITAAVGSATVIATFERGSFRVFVLFWTVVSVAICSVLSIPTPEQMLILIPPATILGGFGIQYLYRRSYWRFLRWGVLGLVILTAYMQILVNIVYPAPNSSEPPWARHAILYWDRGATSSDTPVRCAAINKEVPRLDATVYHVGPWPPSLRWYLRGFRPVPSGDAARLIVDTGTTAGGPDSPERFDFEQQWEPESASLNWHRAFIYFFTLKAWGEVTGKAALLHVKAPDLPARTSPTVIMPPEVR